MKKHGADIYGESFSLGIDENSIIDFYKIICYNIYIYSIVLIYIL